MKNTKPFGPYHTRPPTPRTCTSAPTNSAEAAPANIANMGSVLSSRPVDSQAQNLTDSARPRPSARLQQSSRDPGRRTSLDDDWKGRPTTEPQVPRPSFIYKEEPSPPQILPQTTSASAVPPAFEPQSNDARDNGDGHVHAGQVAPPQPLESTCLHKGPDRVGPGCCHNASCTVSSLPSHQTHLGGKESSSLDPNLKQPDVVESELPSATIAPSADKDATVATRAEMEPSSGLTFQAHEKCVDGWFWRIHRLRDTSEQLQSDMHLLDQGLHSLKDEVEFVRLQQHRWTLWRSHVQSRFKSLVEHYHALKHQDVQAQQEMQKLISVYSQATTRPLMLRPVDTPSPQKVESFIENTRRELRQTFQTALPALGPTPRPCPVVPEPPQAPPPPAPPIMSFQTRIPTAVPPGLVVYNVGDMALRFVMPYGSSSESTAVPAPTPPALRDLSDQWSTVMTILELVARQKTMGVFQGAPMVDPHAFRTQRAVELANLAEQILDWLMDPRYQAELQYRVRMRCGTPAEAQFIAAEDDEHDGSELSAERLFDYLAFAANKAAKTLKEALVAIPNLQLVLVDQRRALWNPKVMHNYHHGNPDRDPSTKNPPIILRWVWPGWRDPATGNVVIKPSVYTGLELEAMP